MVVLGDFNLKPDESGSSFPGILETFTGIADSAVMCHVPRYLRRHLDHSHLMDNTSVKPRIG